MDLPVRGKAVRSLQMPLPPAHMPLLRGRRPLKRWRYVGYYGPDLMLCVGDARIGAVPQRWWAIAFPDGRIVGRTTLRHGGVHSHRNRVSVSADGVSFGLTLDESDGVEIASPTSQGQYIWTRKQAHVPMHGVVQAGELVKPIDGFAFVDESAGYHDRHTVWKWSAGNGVATDGRAVAWNLVTGVHDAPVHSERTVWIDGDALEVAPVAFAEGLEGVGELRFTPEAERVRRDDLLLLASDYRQPFGTFAGTLPDGTQLASGYGVMERHRARW